MSAVYKSICFELDTLLLHVTSLTDKEVQLKVHMEKMMNEGFVYIAKARYIMGSTCVTRTQLPTANSNPIKPVATVCREEINNSWVFKIERKVISKHNEVMETEGLDNQMENTSYYINRDSNSSSKTSFISTKSETEFRNLLQIDPKLIKKSKNAFLINDDSYQDYHNDFLDELSNTDSNDSLVSVTDPIRLFGVLVPNALKQAQLIFNGVVNLLGECATLQAQLRETLAKCYHLKTVKQIIEEASKTAKIKFLVPKVYWTPSQTSLVSCHPLEVEGEGEEFYKPTTVHTKSIRSVFFDDKDIGAQDFQEAEYSVFGSDSDSDYE